MRDSEWLHITAQALNGKWNSYAQTGVRGCVCVCEALVLFVSLFVQPYCSEVNTKCLFLFSAFVIELFCGISFLRCLEVLAIKKVSQQLNAKKNVNDFFHLFFAIVFSVFFRQ